MCNEVARRIALNQMRLDFSQTRIELVFPEGLPNLAPLDSIRITDTTVIVRAADAAGKGALVQRRWSWPGPGGRPLYNYRSEGRDFRNGTSSGRCLVPIDGFYEFTTPPSDPGAPKPKRKDKWRFTPAADSPLGNEMFCVAGLWREDAQVGEAFTLLTCEPGPDIAPYHSRQIVLLPRDSWRAWLDGEVPAKELIAPAPAGSLAVARVTRG